MIQPDAKCVVNGHKVNEVIDALNPLLNMDIIIGNVAQPQIQYSSGAVQIVIPPGGGASTNEELDIIDDNNQASTRWFLTTTTQGSGGAAIASGTGTNIGSIGGKNNTAPTTGDRDKLGGGIAGGPAGGKNRDNLDRAAAGGGAAPIGGNDGQGGVVGGGIIINNPQGMPLFDPTTGKAVPGTGTNRTGGGDAPQGMPKYDPTTGKAVPGTGSNLGGGGDSRGAFGGGTDQFGNELYADGTRVTPGGMPVDRSGGGLPDAYANGNGMPVDRSGGGLPDAYANGNGMPTDRSGGGLPDAYANGNGMPTDRSGGGTDGTSQPSRDPVYAPGQPRTVDKFGKPINQAYKKPAGGQKAGETHFDYLVRMAKNDPATHGPTLKRQIEADMYEEAYDKAKAMSYNSGVPFDSNNFNAQWEHQASRRKQLVDQQFNRLIGRQ